MYDVIIAVGEEEDAGAAAQAQGVIDLPGDASEKRVRVLHSFTDNPSGASITQLKPARTARDRLEDAGIEVELDERSGDPATAVLMAAEEQDTDLICLGGSKRTPTGKALFGSVAQVVLLEAKVPVMVCHPER